MGDVALELELFEAAYKSAVEANARGDIPKAKRMFTRAAELMESAAAKSEPPLDATRAERAKKLRFIAENLTAKMAATGGDDTSDSPRANAFINVAAPTDKITFDDIIGLNEAKAAINKLLIYPLKNPQAYSKYGIKAGGFILLEGPPGTGKTTFAKAAASELTVPFAEVNANALVDSYIGKTGKNIDAMFAEARALAAEKHTPVVLFLDEIDYLAQKRGGENKTAAEAVPALIKQMDGFSTNSDDLVLIAATNIRDSLDPAILSRFRNVIHIDLPNAAERKLMLAAKLKRIDKADFDAIDLDGAAALTGGFSGRALSQIALDVMNALAARDAGISALGMPLDEYVKQLIARRK